MSDRREFLRQTGIAAGVIAASGALRKAEAAGGSEKLLEPGLRSRG